MINGETTASDQGREGEGEFTDAAGQPASSDSHEGASGWAGDAEALARLAAIVGAATSVGTATIVAALIAARQAGARDVDPEAIPRAAGLGTRLAVTVDRLIKADEAFTQAFGFNLLARRTLDDRMLGIGDIDEPGREDDLASRHNQVHRRIGLSSALLRLLDEPPVAIEAMASGILPAFDSEAASWIATLRVAAASAMSVGAGQHLLLRCARIDSRETTDLARALQRDGVKVRFIEDDFTAWHLLQAEWHAGHAPAIILVAADGLAEKSDAADDYDASTASGLLQPTRFARRALPWLPLLRQVHVWRVAETGTLSPCFDGLIGGCIGPIRAVDRAAGGSGAAPVESDAAGLGARALAALARRAPDPRDRAALIATARCAAAARGVGVDEACAIVAASFAGSREPAPLLSSEFDPRLLVCDEEALLLLERAEALAANGGRVLAWGPPGGGKSTWARVLATRAAAGRPVITVTPASVLARPWGATERLLRALWARAAAEGATLLVDEIDALCAARELGSPGGNASLIRCLTDEWLRNLDDYPSVPVVATLNDVLAMDDAVRRRFAFVVAFGDALPPEREHLAWRVVLGTEPPPNWTPIGASVADLAMARARCRMLGLADADALAAAVVRARDARLGPGRIGKPHTRRGGLVH